MRVTKTGWYSYGDMSYSGKADIRRQMLKHAEDTIHATEGQARNVAGSWTPVRVRITIETIEHTKKPQRSRHAKRD